ncbi:hypothetical protein Y032_0559g3456 [Ancylostoma ceylanicum]|uniref:7TM GPCR serpentine receptor class x (Srx) domain-containing protein n=1 Tax=Ancylostoma ceylanicum TaxID=53326 RepID=A0A016WRS7_9BILA|nr:hypothetical protein Y032_0559g3456 [Ancylostoma ceylanicum]
MDENDEQLSELHLPFFISYIVVGVVFLLFHIRFIVLIQRTRSIAKLPAYRIIQHASIACSINLVTQIIAVSCTLNRGHMDYTLNSIIGAFFQGSWAVEYPMILILAVNRLMSVAWPMRARYLCGLKVSNALIGLCWAFGAVNTITCLSGQIQTIWLVYTPGFVFTKGTLVAMIVHYIDLYFAEFVVISSLICYVFIFILLATKRDPMSSIRIELPLTLHFGTIFVMTAVILYLWHNPASDSDLYSHIFNLINILRYCVSPVLAIFTNEIIRKRFFTARYAESTITPITQMTKF